MKYHYYYGDKGGYEARCRVEKIDIVNVEI